jgi:predicted NodU family carbamoyl transferase
MLTLGIESSCDDTSIALVKDGREVLASIVSSQIEIHKRFGGVVPEIASRKHLEAILPLLKQALEKAQIKLDDIDQVAVTTGPGLLGPLLTGLSFAKSLAWDVEEILRSFDSPLMDVAGGGLKIGLAVKENHLAMAIFGSLGIPGLDVDYEISASRILYHCLEL